MDDYWLLQKKCETRKREIISLLNAPEEKWKRVKTGHEKLQEKKDALSKENGGVDVSNKDILNINAGGTIVRVSRGTLTQFEGTRIEAIFSGRWEKQLNRDDLGRIFLDVNPVCFKAIVDYLNECKISSPENRPDPPYVDFAEYGECLDCLLMAFDLSDLVFPVCDSVILSESNHTQSMRNFLREDDIPLGLNLLYRGTRDGMNPRAFHQKCDHMGATVIIVKTMDGYIFGGYADKSWCSNERWINSESAFLFGIFCHGSHHPIKMRVLSGKGDKAFFGGRSFGPIFGFDTDNDLNLFRCGPSTSALGNSYALPSGKNCSFFTGHKNFTPVEVEVFQVNKNMQNVNHEDKETTKLNVGALSKNIEECLDLEKRAIAQATDELVELEESFEQEENAVRLFCSGGDDNNVINLNVSGQRVAVSRSTLSQYPDSVLYKQFADPKWQEFSANGHCLLPRDWDSKRVLTWAKSIKRTSSDISEYFKEVTGGELLVMGREDIKSLGIDKPGTVALLIDNIEKLREMDEEMSVPLVEHSAYCIEKIVDRMRMKAMSGVNLIPAPGPPYIRESERNRFRRIVEYFFPNESASDFVAEINNI